MIMPLDFLPGMYINSEPFSTGSFHASSCVLSAFCVLEACRRLEETIALKSPLCPPSSLCAFSVSMVGENVSWVAIYI